MEHRRFPTTTHLYIALFSDVANRLALREPLRGEPELLSRARLIKAGVVRQMHDQVADWKWTAEDFTALERAGVWVWTHPNVLDAQVRVLVPLDHACRVAKLLGVL